MMRLRQAVWVAEDLESVVGELKAVLGAPVAYRDPGVAAFGLHNALLAVGETFLEVVSPTKPGTAAGRHLERRGGDGGYMVILQVDDLELARKRVADLGIRVVWQADLENIAGTHLHPSDVGGAILSIDWACPPESWHWAGTDWRKAAVPGEVSAVELQSSDPDRMGARWAEVLGRTVDRGSISLDQGTLRFVEATDGRGDGLGGIDVALPGATPSEEVVAGVRLRVVPHVT